MKIISAGAGSGKTYRLTQEMVKFLQDGEVRASGIIATTFTNKAAAELQERVRVKLLEEGLSKEADELANALIGTVHGLGVKLLKRFAFEAGVSPEVDIVADEDQQLMFNQSLSMVLTNKRIAEMEGLADRLGLNKVERYDWRREVKNITDVARSNDFSKEVLEKSKVKSFESLAEFLGDVSTKTNEEFSSQLNQLLNSTIATIEANPDSTKTTQTAINNLKIIRNELQLRGELNWHQWVKIAKTKVGAKSKDDFFDLKEFAWTHDTHPQFHKDIQDFINGIFDVAVEAIEEYDQYKKSRGLIDYIDMELQVKRLLDHPSVQQVLREELDLLMVDEFQDTSPIQLEIFYKLSTFAKKSVWVGDPKQSIYGFRGADPKLMQAIIEQQGGVQPEDIQEFSWRSREDIVHLTNAIFCKAFPDIKDEQITLKPKRCKIATADTANKEDEPIELSDAIIHWHFDLDSDKKRHPAGWMENAIAQSTRTLIERKTAIIPKGETKARPIQAGDVAVLCRSNYQCQAIAEAFHRAGLKAAISRAGLLKTAESVLILACLKYFLNEADSLSIAEIQLLASNKNIEAIIEDRLQFLQDVEENKYLKWGVDDPIIQRIQVLRREAIEFSSSEILNLLLEELDLRRIIATWGNEQQRFDNIDVLRKFALQYEEGCNRLHTAASLGGFLLWLQDQAAAEKDSQGSGKGANAVNVVTYHKSKGLEYPVVILFGMEGNLRDNVWGMHIIQEQEKVDLTNILGNRWLRYWINPYGDQSKNTPLVERINEHDIKRTATQQALEEEARLLYVGITRARDYLIFPTRSKPTKWLNRVWHEGNEAFPTLDATTTETPWFWNDKNIHTNLECTAFGSDFTSTPMEQQPILQLEAPVGRQEHPDYFIDPLKDTLKGTIQCIKTHKPHFFSTTLSVKEDAVLPKVAKAHQAFLTADRASYAPKDRIRMANDLIHRYDVEEMVDATSLIQYSNQWQAYLKQRFDVKTIYRMYPIRFAKDNRVFETVLDTLVETQTGWVIIQHHSFSGEQKKWRSKCKEHCLWLELSKQAIQTYFQNNKVQTQIHFMLNGAVVEVETEER